jgi:hypothetical protein
MANPAPARDLTPRFPGSAISLTNPLYPAKIAAPTLRAGGLMKVSIDFDCTPAEAREFFGLPDVKPMQEKVMEEVEKRMMAQLDSVSPESILRSWMAFAPDQFQTMLKNMMSYSGMGKTPAG